VPGSKRCNDTNKCPSSFAKCSAACCSMQHVAFHAPGPPPSSPLHTNAHQHLTPYTLPMLLLTMRHALANHRRPHNASRSPPRPQHTCPHLSKRCNEGLRQVQRLPARLQRHPGQVSGPKAVGLTLPPGSADSTLRRRQR
jgi:hypothetical protein